MEDSFFKFLGYRITNFNLDIKDNSNSILSQNIDIQHNFNKENKYYVEVVMIITIKNADNTVFLSTTIKGAFQSIKPIPDELFKQMYTINAPAILYPFARAFIASVTSQTNTNNSIVLPLVNFQKS